MSRGPSIQDVSSVLDVYAPLGRRLLAYIIDYLIGTFSVVTLTAIIGKGDNAAMAPLAAFVALWLYKSGFECSRYQGTLGKMALGIKVTSLQGERIGFLHSTGRTLAFLLTCFTCGIGFVVGAFTKRRQMLHDLMARTLVVRQGVSAQEVVETPAAPPGSGAVVAVVVVVCGVGIVGILAAIAIPAYQDYTIRSQVIEGLNLASPYETAVAEALSNGTDISSASAQDLNLNASATGQYVDSVILDHGAVVITFRASANPVVQGRHLVIYPTKGSQNSVVWTCGYHAAPGDRLDNPNGRSTNTDIQQRYLPQSCRS